MLASALSSLLSSVCLKLMEAIQPSIITHWVSLSYVSATYVLLADSADVSSMVGAQFVLLHWFIDNVSSHPGVLSLY